MQEELEPIFTSIYTVEMCTKILAMGFIMHPDSDVITGLVECSPIELEADDGEDDDGEEEEEGDVHQGTDGLRNGGHHHLETWKKNVKVSGPCKFSQQSCSKYCFNNLSLASTLNLLSW